LRTTVEWYQSNREWMAHATSGEYRTYYERLYGKDLRKPAAGQETEWNREQTLDF